MAIGKSIDRLDAFEKVTGSAKFAQDLIPQNALVAKILRSTIANGIVKRIDISKAEKLEGVEKIITCFDVPQKEYATPGHPFALDEAHADISDRLMLNKRVRYYGDDIGVVVAINELIARQALDLIEVEYEDFEPILSYDSAFNDKNDPLHAGYKNNVVDSLNYSVVNQKISNITNNYAKVNLDAVKRPSKDDLVVEKNIYYTPIVQHAHIETVCAFAYMESKRITVVSTTQIPHIMRRLLSEALDYPIGDIRVIKPYLGGGFGNKQDIHYEPLLAYLSMQLDGRCVSIVLTREETFVNTRTRHAIDMDIESIADKNGKNLLYRELNLKCIQGGYAAHGHAVAANAVTNFAQTYKCPVQVGYSSSVYANLPSGGAMRGYGIPQITFAVESHMDELAKKLDIDPVELRKKHIMELGDLDPFDNITCSSNGLLDCLEEGKKAVDWNIKRKEYPIQNKGDIKKGVGMALFAYKTGVYPISLETGSCRIVMNQDGSVSVQIGATEIGQGSDTVFAQMVAEILGVSIEKVNVISKQDTDVSPFDLGAYASRQSYVSGGAAKKAAKQMKQKVIERAIYMLDDKKTPFDIKEDQIINVNTGKSVCSVGDVATYSLYNMEDSEHIVSEATNTVRDNAFAFGTCFVDLEVDIKIGKIKVNKFVCHHDSGKILNPKLAEAQVHGGAGMGYGYAVGEKLLFNEKSGKPLNNNFLDYKMPTAMDIPDIGVGFVETYEPTGPFGNKALGEPPILAIAPAIRNAIFHATGVQINELPLSPQTLVKNFVDAGMLEKIGE